MVQMICIVEPAFNAFVWQTLSSNNMPRKQRMKRKNTNTNEEKKRERNIIDRKVLVNCSIDYLYYGLVVVFDFDGNCFLRKC